MVATRGLPKHRAEILAAELDIELDCGVCLGCLSIVAGTLRAGAPAQVRGVLCSITPNLGHEGLAEIALAAVGDAVGRDVPDAEAALTELEWRGGRSGVARAIVRQLALELTRRAEVEKSVAELARDRLTLGPPEWN